MANRCSEFFVSVGLHLARKIPVSGTHDEQLIKRNLSSVFLYIWNI